MCSFNNWVLDYLINNNSDTNSNDAVIVKILEYEVLEWGMLASVTDGNTIISARFTKKDIKNLKWNHSHMQFDDIILRLTEYCYDIRIVKENLGPVLKVKKCNLAGYIKGLKFKNLRHCSVIEEIKSLILNELLRILKRNNISIKKFDDVCSQITQNKIEENLIMMEPSYLELIKVNKSFGKHEHTSLKSLKVDNDILTVDILIDEFTKCNSNNYTVKIHKQKLDNLVDAQNNNSIVNIEFNDNKDSVIVLEGNLDENISQFDISLFKPIKTSSQKFPEHKHNDSYKANPIEENHFNVDCEMKDHEIKQEKYKDDDPSTCFVNTVTESGQVDKSATQASNSFICFIIKGLCNKSKTSLINEINNINVNELQNDCHLEMHDLSDSIIPCIKATDFNVNPNAGMDMHTILNIIDSSLPLNSSGSECTTKQNDFTKCKTKLCPNRRDDDALKININTQFENFESNSKILKGNKIKDKKFISENILTESKNNLIEYSLIQQANSTKIAKEKEKKILKRKKKKVPTATLR